MGVRNDVDPESDAISIVAVTQPDNGSTAVDLVSGDVAYTPDADYCNSPPPFDSFVYTVNGEHFIRTPVKVGLANADRVEITDGLYAGDQVVWQPVMALWMTELAAVKGGQACCVEPPKGK